MKGPREMKRLMALIRKYDGKGNGVIPAFALDSMHLFKLERCGARLIAVRAMATSPKPIHRPGWIGPWFGKPKPSGGK